MRFNAKLSAFLAGLSLMSTAPAATPGAPTASPKKPGVTQTVTKSYAAQETALVDTYKPFLAELEGTRYNVYDDRGTPAIGYGYNFDINDPTKHAFIEVKPREKGGNVQLKPKDMALLASGLTLAEKQAKFPQYILTSVSKTASELKKASKPKGMDGAFEGSVFVMSATKVAELNSTRLLQFIHEVEGIVGAAKFNGWPMGARMAYLDMYYPLRGKITNTNFHRCMMAGDWTGACPHAWASSGEKSDPNGKKKRRQETREMWLKSIKATPAQIATLRTTYVANLPGEKALHQAAGTFLTTLLPKGNQGKTNAATKQNSPDRR